ncbi:hypothetical protein [Heyndrickxia coagulans]|uniref:Uncharacterized protein n=1 Tax=Heyndrickxia coagulans DSM 1 = ATCC 7050 TaxID=1121088 RepID=A0A0B5WZ58_HEYCO|nr:hypothetical protein [Heyndrickxia coagulans]AJH77187.1 hypothetical protein BF29_2515 [Heyndrickxia coagulans DSM 1 = ATCC 7050]AJH78546.1 hypothetical protein BF29_2591 [Heyndrickxia coagulans DSM 1 = ATCC 7050]MCR2847333.1 hypothetical protein [Heyndrickxia coagulans]MED4492955.1 hypothetical protein [Heyndrickxia coagulans]MED4535156.1 hypothetical protein [Heyndrickxia coagulans]
MTKDELIELLKANELAGDAKVFIPSRYDDGSLVELDEVNIDRIGTLKNPIEVIVLY